MDSLQRVIDPESKSNPFPRKLSNGGRIEWVVWLRNAGRRFQSTNTESSAKKCVI